MNGNANDNTSWIPLIVVSLAVFIVTLDTTFMNVAISQLVIDLNTSVSTIQAIISFYTLITASLMLVGSRLQDIVGKKKIFLIGSAIYAVGTLTAGISQNAIMLFIGWALLEGIGGALMSPATLSIASETYAGDKRTIALAITSVMAGVAAAIGPLFGGVCTSFFSWRYGFIFELVIIVIIFAFSGKIHNFAPTLSKEHFDLKGSVLLVIGLILLVSGILLLETDPMYTLVLVVLSVIILVLFAKFENKIKEKGETPILDISVFKVRNLTSGTMVRLISTLALGGALFAISVFLQTVLGYDAFATGLNMIPATVGMLIATLIAPKLTTKFSHKAVMAVGFLLSVIASIILSTSFGIYSTFASLAPGMFVFGFGLGFVSALVMDIALVGTRPEDQNLASGVLSTGNSLGTSLGTAIIGCILIVGATYGLHDAANYSTLPNAHELVDQSTQDYIDKLGQINVSEINDTHLAQLVDTAYSGQMKIVMYVTATILIVGLAFTLSLNDGNSKESKSKKK